MKTRKHIKKVKNKKNTFKNKSFTKKHYKNCKSKKIYGGLENKNISCRDMDVKCNFLDKQFKNKINPTWNTCINMNGIYNHMFYITTSNVLIKSIESLQIPEFNVSLSNNTTRCKIMIEDKYINCFIYLCGKWYAMMRLFGKTINTQYFARTEANRAFYELTNIKINLDTNNPDSQNSNSLIIIPDNLYTVLNGSSSKILSTNKNAIEIKLNDSCCKNINKSNNQLVFNVLQRFRQEKLYANNLKKEIAQDVAKDLILGFLK
jgi:hypothetical protein